MTLQFREGTMAELLLALKNRNPIRCTFISTPSHGYLKVSKSDFLKSELTPTEISSFSGISKRYLFLEEDCDAPKFLQHLQKAGLEYKIKEVYQTRVNTTHNYLPEKI